MTALYEIVPAGMPLPASNVDPLKYQKPATASSAADSGELMTVKLRYKAPEGGKDNEDESLDLARNIVHGWPTVENDPTLRRQIGRFVKSFPLKFGFLRK